MGFRDFPWKSQTGGILNMATREREWLLRFCVLRLRFYILVFSRSEIRLQLPMYTTRSSANMNLS